MSVHACGCCCTDSNRDVISFTPVPVFFFPPLHLENCLGMRAGYDRGDPSRGRGRGVTPPGGEARGGGGVGWSSAVVGGADSSSSPDEAFVSRWVIVTDKRMLHVQEEPGWGFDKEKVMALDLTRHVQGLVVQSGARACVCVCVRVACIMSAAYTERERLSVVLLPSLSLGGFRIWMTPNVPTAFVETSSGAKKRRHTT